MEMTSIFSPTDAALFNKEPSLFSRSEDLYAALPLCRYAAFFIALAQLGNCPLSRQSSSSLFRRVASNAAIAPTPPLVHFIPFCFLHRVETLQSLNFSIFVFAIHSFARTLDK